MESYEQNWFQNFHYASQGASDLALVDCLNDTEADVVIMGRLIPPGHQAIVGTIGECRKAAEMYGWPIEPTAPEPEKSPQEKALDDFIARREAKRKNTAPPPPPPGWEYVVGPTKRERDLDRAMQQLAPAEKDFHERLVNVKVAM